MLDECEILDEEHSGRKKQTEQRPARNPNDATLSDELNNELRKRWYPKGEEYTKTQNKTDNKDITVFWKKKYIQLDPLNHNYARIRLTEELFHQISQPFLA